MKIALDDTFGALADPMRRRTIELLSECPRRAGELADALGLAAPAMSKHLKQLRTAGLVEETHPEFDTRVRVYALKSGALDGLHDWLKQTEVMWSDQLTAFKRNIESDNTR